MAVEVKSRVRPADHAAKALAIARSGRAVCYTGQWRQLRRAARLLGAPDGVEVILHRNPDGSGALIVAAVSGLGATPPANEADPGRIAAWGNMAPLANRI